MNCDGEEKEKTVCWIEAVVDSVVEDVDWSTNWLVVRAVVTVDESVEEETAGSKILEVDNIETMVADDTGTVIETEISKDEMLLSINC